jgi:hypothetical protein
VFLDALSFYRSKNVLGWSKFFVPDQKFIYILWQSQTFCARQIVGLDSVELVFEEALSAKEWTGKTIYFNFSSIFGDFFLKFFEEEVSDYLS